MGRRPEGGPHVGRRVAGQLGDVLAQLAGAVAPRVVGVALLEADLAQGVHHRRLGEGLGEPDDLGVVLRHVGDEPLPELHGLGVGVVDAEQGDPVVDPHLHDPADLGVDPRGVVVEVQRVDVLVLLRRVLGVGDGAVAAGGEPLGVGRHPRVVGGALEREVHGDLEAEPPGLRDEGVEVLEGAEVGVDGVVPAVGGADRVGAAGVLGPGVEGVVRALLGCLPDGVHRREVDDVEPHGGDRGQPPRRRAQGARRPAVLLLVVRRALAAREDLVPGSGECQLALDEQGQLGRGRDVVAQRPRGELVLDRRVGAGLQAHRGGAGGVAQAVHGIREHRLLRGGAGNLGARPLEHEGALVEHELGVDVGADLDRRVVLPRAVRVGPALDAVASTSPCGRR